MTRFHCVLQRHDFSTIMSGRIPALTLSGVSVRPQPGDELEITIANPDRSTDTVMTDILTARINADRSAFIVAVRPRRAISEPEPLTPSEKSCRHTTKNRPENSMKSWQERWPSLTEKRQLPAMCIQPPTGNHAGNKRP